ncbi:hypothetical protein S83_035328, partial [Arachis hypogaea]
FKVKLELKRGMLLVPFLLLAFNLQFKVKLEVKRGNAPLVRFSLLAFNLQFK